MLRIIAGKYRSMLLRGPRKGVSTRPILARIKKSLFDILGKRLVDAVFLDLYAGTGAVGMEAISRGARRVTFVEDDARCVRTIAENIALFHEEDHAEIVSVNVLGGFRFRGTRYDIIFMGPPYKNTDGAMLALTGDTLRLIVRERLLVSGGLIVCQHHAKEPIPAVEGLVRFRQEKYGDSILSFYRVPEAQGTMP